MPLTKTTRSTTKKKLWYQKTDPKQRRTLLPEKLKKTFMRKGLTVYDYEGLTQNQERMIFQVSSYRTPVFSGPPRL